SAGPSCAPPRRWCRSRGSCRGRGRLGWWRSAGHVGPAAQALVSRMEYLLETATQFPLLLDHSCRLHHVARMLSEPNQTELPTGSSSHVARCFHLHRTKCDCRQPFRQTVPLCKASNVRLEDRFFCQKVW